MIDSRLAPYGIFLLRVALGAMFIAQGLLKYLVFTMPGFEGFLGKIGLPAALAWPIVLAELVGGATIVAGILRPVGVARASAGARRRAVRARRQRLALHGKRAAAGSIRHS